MKFYPHQIAVQENPPAEVKFPSGLGKTAKIRKERITKVEFYALGGFSNSQLFRLQSRGGTWRYYKRVD